MFRSDLFYRLNVLSVVVPPLKDHVEDIPLLVRHFIAMQGFHKEFDPEALEILKGYTWRGNVRELRNVVERTCILSPGKMVTAADLSFLRPAAAVVTVTEAPHDKAVRCRKPETAYRFRSGRWSESISCIFYPR